MYSLQLRSGIKPAIAGTVAGSAIVEMCNKELGTKRADTQVATSWLLQVAGFKLTGFSQPSVIEYRMTKAGQKIQWFSGQVVGARMSGLSVRSCLMQPLNTRLQFHSFQSHSFSYIWHLWEHTAHHLVTRWVWSSAPGLSSLAPPAGDGKLLACDRSQQLHRQWVEKYLQVCIITYTIKSRQFVFILLSVHPNPMLCKCAIRLLTTYQMPHFPSTSSHEQLPKQAHTPQYWPSNLHSMTCCW